MRTLIQLVSFFLLKSTVLSAGAISSATVFTSTIDIGPLGGSICSLTSSGAAISCESGLPGNPGLAQAQASSSAGLGFLSLEAATGAFTGSAVASASASYDFTLYFLPTVSGMITGEYSVSARTEADFTPGGPNGSISLGQTNATGLTFPVAESTFITNPVLLVSDIVAGQPLEILGSGSMFTDTPGGEGSMASIQLIGFFDQDGNPLTFTTVPEPTLFPMIFLVTGLVWGLTILRKKSVGI
jgi:hypothetical protein